VIRSSDSQRHAFIARTLRRPFVLAAGIVVVLSACAKKEEAAVPIGKVPVERRDIVVDAQATGTVEPIEIVEVKSQASGLVLRMPVETGTNVNPGDLIVQIDTRDLTNQLEQAQADLRSSEASLEVAKSNRDRSDELYKGRIITAQENEQANLQYTQAQANVIRVRTSVNIAQQRLDEARVTAPVSGTIISKPVSLGQVIQSATSVMGGGTTIVTMADLSRVQMRAFMNETDIGRISAGQEARVVVDAFPNRTFNGSVEKVEPQAVIQQSVTMFPVIISLANNERLLLPGMNGEVSVNVERKLNVVAVPNDAVRNMRDAAASAEMLGLDPEAVMAALNSSRPAGEATAAAADTSAGRSVPMGGRGGDSSARVAQGGGAPTGGAAARGAAGGATRGGAAGAANGRPSGGGGGLAARRNPSPARQGVVFVVTDSGTYEPRMVRLGVADYDFSEVISGLQEGEMVASLAMAALQAAREQRNARFSGMGGVPGLSRTTPAAPGGGGGGGGGGPRGGM
jgi:HlyD family secretion protein